MSHDKICSSNVSVVRADGTSIAVGDPTDLTIGRLFFGQISCLRARSVNPVTQ